MFAMTYADKVDQLLNLKGWNQQDLVRSVGDLSASTVTGWKKGATPRIDVALKVARALGVSLDYLADEAIEIYHSSLSVDESPEASALDQVVKLIGPAEALRRILGTGPAAGGSPQASKQVEVLYGNQPDKP